MAMTKSRLDAAWNAPTLPGASWESAGSPNNAWCLFSRSWTVLKCQRFCGVLNELFV